uniref:Uncharacterized protein n=1 Tax=Phaeomonas parva TaxID=124430 RepID=A0A7S1TW03_9STRA|mmetsp:Transcript_20317/g.61671  ORF Transcript_20317/g.61671 Transcript_20317/m.61671 type:complete len:246 (+) Transcript_20317:156-893(+)
MDDDMMEAVTVAYNDTSPDSDDDLDDLAMAPKYEPPPLEPSPFRGNFEIIPDGFRAPRPADQKEPFHRDPSLTVLRRDMGETDTDYVHKHNAPRKFWTSSRRGADPGRMRVKGAKHSITIATRYVDTAMFQSGSLQPMYVPNRKTKKLQLHSPDKVDATLAQSLRGQELDKILRKKKSSQSMALSPLARSISPKASSPVPPTPSSIGDLPNLNIVIEEKEVPGAWDGTARNVTPKMLWRRAEGVR